MLCGEEEIVCYIYYNIQWRGGAGSEWRVYCNFIIFIKVECAVLCCVGQVFVYFYIYYTMKMWGRK